jgi:hypothetical protein
VRISGRYVSAFARVSSGLDPVVRLAASSSLACERLRRRAEVLAWWPPADLKQVS